MEERNKKRAKREKKTTKRIKKCKRTRKRAVENEIKHQKWTWKKKFERMTMAISNSSTIFDGYCYCYCNSKVSQLKCKEQLKYEFRCHQRLWSNYCVVGNCRFSIEHVCVYVERVIYTAGKLWVFNKMLFIIHKLLTLWMCWKKKIARDRKRHR